MTISFILGNIFSLLSALCIVVSVVKKSKADLVLWQLWSIFLSIFETLFLQAYAALITCVVDLIRNWLAYKDKLNFKITLVLLVLCIIIGLYFNNLGLIGVLGIIASISYTVAMYVTTNEQQMRWAFVFNQFLWVIHNIYIQAIPSVIMSIVLGGWTAVQIFKNRKRKNV